MGASPHDLAAVQHQLLRRLPRGSDTAGCTGAVEVGLGKARTMEGPRPGMIRGLSQETTAAQTHATFSGRGKQEAGKSP